MFSKFLLSERDIEAIQKALLGNPLLASLLMISPLDAFRYLNLVPRFFDALFPTSTEDADLVRDLLGALQAGQTTLQHPQEVAQEVEEPVPAAETPPIAAEATAAPDITLSVGKAALQRALHLYAEGNFKDQQFVFPAQRWMDVKTRGVGIDLDLAPDRARIIARLWGSFAFRAGFQSLDRLTERLDFPIEIELLTGLAVDAENTLLLNVRDGEMSIVNPPLPERVAQELVKKIVGEMPSIPLVQLPARFDIPGEPPSALELTLHRINIDADGLTLEFHL